MKSKDIRKKSEKEIKEALAEKRERLRSFIFKNSAGKMKNTKAIMQEKKSIARILTILKESKK